MSRTIFGRRRSRRLIAPSRPLRTHIDLPGELLAIKSGPGVLVPAERHTASELQEFPLTTLSQPPIIRIEDEGWFAFISAPRMVRAAARELTRAGVPVYVPMRRAWRVRRRGTAEVREQYEVPLFGIYGFVRITDERALAAALSTEHVTNIFGERRGADERFSVKSEASRGMAVWLAELAERERRGFYDEDTRYALITAEIGSPVRVAPTFPIGSAVTIASGPLAGRTGTLAADLHQDKAARAIFNFLGAARPVQIPADRLRLN